MAAVFSYRLAVDMFVGRLILTGLRRCSVSVLSVSLSLPSSLTHFKHIYLFICERFCHYITFKHYSLLLFKYFDSAAIKYALTAANFEQLRAQGQHQLETGVALKVGDNWKKLMRKNFINLPHHATDKQQRWNVYPMGVLSTKLIRVTWEFYLKTERFYLIE